MDDDQNMTGGGMVNPIQVEKFLSGVNYPVSKSEIIDAAKRNGADKEVLQTLEKIPDQQFESPVDISEAIGQFE